jgi:Uma2 family endonuclease
MAETDKHRTNMVNLIATIDDHFAADPEMYVSSNMFVYYVEGERNKHLSPDVFVVRGVPRRLRDYYMIWREGKTLDLAIEITSRSTRGEDLEDKFRIYRDEMRVYEYFLFDPNLEFLKPSLQGYRLQKGQYVPIPRVRGRLPSEVLGLHLERVGWELRLYDPKARRRLLTPAEAAAQAEARARRAEAREQQEAQALRRAEAEIERLRQELEQLRQSPSEPEA